MKKLITIISIFIALFITIIFTNKVSAATPVSNSNNIIANKAFVLALENDYPPFLFYDNGSPKGISYDYTKLVADKLGYSLKTTEPLQLQQMLDAVKTGKANLLSDITKTPERSTFLEFSDPYIETPAVIIGRKNEPTKWSENQSNENINVAVGKGYGVVSYLKNKYPKADFIEFSSDTEVLQAVALGATDVGVLDEASLSYVLLKKPLSNVEIIGQTGFNYSLSFAVAQNNKTVLPLINQAIASITPQERSAIFSKWISALPVEKETDTQSTIPNYALYIAAGLILLVIIALVIIIILRNIINNKTLELRNINKGLDAKAQEKIKEALDMANVNALQKSNLEDTKKAMLNILEDVEEEKNKFSAISKRLDLATSGANIGISEWDVEHNSLLWNDEMYHLFDIDKSKISSTTELLEHSRAVILPEDEEKTASKREAELKEGGKYDIIFRVKWRNGSVHYLRSFGTTEEKNGKVVKIYSVNLDVTHEQEVDKAKTEFVSLASHQLRTPLTAIKWYAEMLTDEKRGKLSDTQRKYLKQVTDGNERMIELVNDLLNVSRLDLGTFSVEPELTNIVKLTQTITADLAPLIQTKHIKLTQNYAKDIPKINTDPTLMRVVIENILSNSIKYTPQKGKVDVAVKKDKTNLLISIKDSGMGIPKNQQDKIFTKLFRADNATSSAAEGTGLGLYMVKGIVDNAGGKIWFESALNKGTTFFVKMPLKGMQKKEGGKKIEQST